MSNINFFTSNQNISNLLASRIKDERVAQRLKQKDLAVRAGVKPHVVRNLEQHSVINLDNLISIMRALNKLDVFEEMFDFAKERIEVDAFKYQEEHSKRAKKRVYDAK